MNETEKGELLYQEDRDSFFWRWTGFFLLGIFVYIILFYIIYMTIIDKKYVKGIMPIILGIALSNFLLWFSIKMKRGIFYTNGIEIEKILPLRLLRKNRYIEYRNLNKIIYNGYKSRKYIFLLNTNEEIIIERIFFSEKIFNILLNQIPKLSKQYKIDLEVKWK